MARRDDLTIDWSTSPRLVTIASPSVAISVQEIIDTLRFFEDSLTGNNYEYLIAAAGKEFLGGTTYVGITAIMNNCKIAFAARPGPDWILCTISGGNLVAIDANGASMDPRHPTAYTTVDRTASSSATLSEQDALQYASYGGGISLDIINGEAGTDYPIGNMEYPVNNLTDAVTIANSKGFKTIFIRESMTGGDALDGGTNISGFTLIGDSDVSTSIELHTSLIASKLIIKNCNVTGTLDGESEIVDCSVGDLNYINGDIHHCGLYGIILLDGNKDVVINNCYTSDQDNPCIIDMGGSGQDLAMPNYSGIVTVRNLSSATEEIGIGLNAGIVILDSTITAGTVIVSGIGTLTDNSTGTAIVNNDALLNRELIHKTGWEKVYIDTVKGTSGTTFPIGTAHTPVDNIANAKTIADNNHISKFYLHDNITLTGDWSGYEFESASYEVAQITCSNVILNKTIFNRLKVIGSCASGELTGNDCNFPQGFTNMYADLENCQMTGTFTLQNNGYIKGDRCTSATSSIIDMVDTTSCSLLLANFSGVLSVINATDSGITAAVAGNYLLTLDSSCTKGSGLMSGIGILINNSTMDITERTLPASTWKENIADSDSDTAGEDVKAIKRNTGLIPAGL